MDALIEEIADDRFESFHLRLAAVGLGSETLQRIKPHAQLTARGRLFRPRQCEAQGATHVLERILSDTHGVLVLRRTERRVV